MIKKLVKYGNSSAIVLEKPLLELLGIKEGSFFKVITTDGKSLTLTPINDENTSSLAPADALAVAARNVVEQQHQERDQQDVSTFEQSKAFQDQVEMGKPFMAELFKKHAATMSFFQKTLADTDYQHEMQQLAMQYDPATQSEKFITESLTIRYKYCPEIKTFDDEMQALQSTLSTLYASVTQTNNKKS